MTVDPADAAANTTTVRPRRLHHGTVVAFDDDVGLGTIHSGGVDVLFHGVEIADGSRHVLIGAEVFFEPLARFGSFQAGRVTKAIGDGGVDDSADDGLETTAC